MPKHQSEKMYHFFQKLLLCAVVCAVIFILMGLGMCLRAYVHHDLPDLGWALGCFVVALQLFWINRKYRLVW